MDIRYKFEWNCFWHDFEINICQEKFNDNKGKLSEAVIRKKTNNTMAKWKRQTIQWPNEKRQTIQWPNEKDKQYNGQMKKDKQYNDQMKKRRSTKHYTEN